MPNPSVSLFSVQTLKNSTDGLITLDGAYDRQTVEVLGYDTPNDGGGGTFYWDSFSTTPQNDGTVFNGLTPASGRWKRIIDEDISVKWFGAKGNNAGDDTSSIQKTLQFIIDNYAGFWLDLSTPIGAKVRSSPTLYFPPGIYRVSSVSFNNDVLDTLTIKGDNAIIRPSQPNSNPEILSAPAFNMPLSYKTRIIGVSFVEFDQAVKITNNDILDSNQVVIEGCNFQGCKKALYIETHTSVILQCKFHTNLQSLEVIGEKVVVKENWFTANNMPAIPDGDYPCQIKNYAFMRFEANTLVPPDALTGSPKSAWINNYGSVVADDIRLGAERNSFTLINNYAGVDSISSLSYEPRWVIVRNSLCCTNIPESPNSYQPSILRYVTKIPNLTLIEGNVSSIYGKLVAFDNATTPANIIANSGDVSVESVCVDIYNNVGGALYPHSSHIPIELYPFVRNESSKWPSKTSLALTPKAVTVDPSGSSITYTFDYPGTFDSGSGILSLEKNQFMINYTAPAAGVIGAYGGIYTAYMKAIGYFEGDERYHLYLNEVLNHSSNPDAPSGYPPANGAYTVTLSWDDPINPITNTTDLSLFSSNRTFRIKITGRVGTSADHDRISVLPLFSI